MTRYILGVALVVFVLVLGAAEWMHLNPSVIAQNGQTTTTSPIATTTTISGSTASGYTLADVAKHNSASSCWTAINGSVYDLTDWINQHPGGPGPILSLCGTDGTAAFEAQHGGQGRPEQELASLLIGTLTQ